MLPRVLTALPVFNEEAHVCRVLDEVRLYSQDIIVVDDGSSDRTPELLSRRMDVRTLTHEVNQGYGAALRTAFLYALENDYDVLVTIDCDGQHEPRLIPEMAAAVFPTEGEPYDLISGSRYKQVFAGDSVAPEERRRINMEITDWLNRRFHFGLTDAFCGFKAYRVPARRSWRSLNSGMRCRCNCGFRRPVISGGSPNSQSHWSIWTKLVPSGEHSIRPSSGCSIITTCSIAKWRRCNSPATSETSRSQRPRNARVRHTCLD